MEIFGDSSLLEIANLNSDEQIKFEFNNFPELVKIMMLHLLGYLLYCTCSLKYLTVFSINFLILTIGPNIETLMAILL